MFTDEEKLSSNCTGTRGKNQLDKKKLETIKSHVLQYWPPDGTESEDTIWKDCIKAIDEGGEP